MLSIADRRIVHGFEVYRHKNDQTIWYVIPRELRYRLDDKGKPVFKFVKYRFPIDRADGKKGGAWVLFDIAFYVPQDAQDKIRETLQQSLTPAGGQPPEIKLAPPQYTKGSANFILKNEDGSIIESVSGAARPSGYGDQITAFALELTPEGAALFEATMKGQGVGGVIVEYDVSILAALPPLTATAWFNGLEFYSYFQQRDIDWEFWTGFKQREAFLEQAYSSETTGVRVDMPFVLPEGPEATTKLKESIRNSMKAALHEAVARKALKAIDPVAADKREIPKDSFWDVIRNTQTIRDVSIHDEYVESSAIEWSIHPNGNIPNITTMTGPDGTPFKWEDYSVTIDAEDAFFKQLNVGISVNADFEKLPLHSVEVHVEYKEGQTRKIGEFAFKDPDTPQKFSVYVANDNWSYKWWYEVNYKGSSKTFRSAPATTDEKILTVNVDDLGVLHAEFEANAIDWSQVAAAEIAFAYAGQGRTIKETLTLTEAKPKATIVKALFAPRDRAYTYTVTYLMADGREFTGAEQTGTGDRVIVNDVFQTKTIPIRVAGDLSFDGDEDPSRVIDEILLHVSYTEGGGLSHSTDVALSADQPFFDWRVPVVGRADGTVRYSGHIRHHDGTTAEIAEQTAEKPTILVGDVVAKRSTVTMVTDLLDFSELKLVKVGIRHGDRAGSFLFKPEGPTEATFALDGKDKGDIAYEWTATYFLVDGTRRSAKDTTIDPMLVLELPPAATPAIPAL